MRLLLVIIFILAVYNGYSQDTTLKVLPDTTIKSSETPVTQPVENTVTPPSGGEGGDSLKKDAVSTEPANNVTPPSSLEDTSSNDMGIAVSPSSMFLRVKPGTSALKEINVTNDTPNKYKFFVTFNDFEMGTNGKPIAVKPGEGKYALSKWINISPTYFELEAHKKQKIRLTVSPPDNDEGYRAAWTMVVIDQAIDRPKLDVTPSEQLLAFGVTTSIAFGVYIYQNPPNVKINNVEITQFTLNEADGKRKIHIEVKNVGDGIGQCIVYIEYSNLNTGLSERLPNTRFTILPQFDRIFDFALPDSLAKGNYSVAGVLDFGSKEEIKSAELEFLVQ